MFLLTLLAIVPITVWAAPRPAWADRPYPYVVVDQGVRQVLQELGRNLSIPVVMTEAVNGQVHGRVKADSAEDFLKQICQANDLAWFYDGSALYISSQTNLQTQTFSLDGVDRAGLMQQIKAMKIGSPLDARAIGDTLRIVGPNSWVAVVKSLVKDSRITPAGGAVRVRVFRGRGDADNTAASSGKHSG